MKTWTNPEIEELDVSLTAYGNDRNHCEWCHNSVDHSNGNASHGHGGTCPACGQSGDGEIDPDIPSYTPAS